MGRAGGSGGGGGPSWAGLHDAMAPPSHPPPYRLDDFPMTWSAGSIHGLVQHVARSIHSSLGMGEWRLRRVAPPGLMHINV